KGRPTRRHGPCRGPRPRPHPDPVALGRPPGGGGRSGPRTGGPVGGGTGGGGHLGGRGGIDGGRSGRLDGGGPWAPTVARGTAGAGRRRLRRGGRRVDDHLGPAGRRPPSDPYRRAGAGVTLVERASGFLESKLSRRSFVNRSAFVGSAVAVGSGVDLLLRPGTAYGYICECGDAGCGCGSTCCSGFSEFCCSINGGYNYCPTGTVMGGWWKADNSSYCDGPRYYMDCNASCSCTTGCGGGWGFCDTDCDGTTCGCGPAGCNSWMTGCL